MVVDVLVMVVDVLVVKVLDVVGVVVHDASIMFPYPFQISKQARGQHFNTVAAG